MSTYHMCVKSGKKGTAAQHAAYIAREGKFSKADKAADLVATGHGNLPEWAGNNPSTFWKAADKHERANGAAYREFEVALPRELTTAQQTELVQDFIDRDIGSKPHQYAIHSPPAALGKGSQPHAHIMVSDRKPDGITRGPEQQFKRYNPDKPELGGCKKDSGGKDRETLRSDLINRRKTWADLTNAHLEKNGHVSRVDHRSNLERGITTAAGRHLGQARIKRMAVQESTAHGSE